jgi:hypothetical protein
MFNFRKRAQKIEEPERKVTIIEPINSETRIVEISNEICKLLSLSESDIQRFLVDGTYLDLEPISVNSMFGNYNEKVCIRFYHNSFTPWEFQYYAAIVPDWIKGGLLQTGGGNPGIQLNRGYEKPSGTYDYTYDYTYDHFPDPYSSSYICPKNKKFISEVMRLLEEGEYTTISD